MNIICYIILPRGALTVFLDTILLLKKSIILHISTWKMIANSASNLSSKSRNKSSSSKKVVYALCETRHTNILLQRPDAGQTNVGVGLEGLLRGTTVQRVVLDDIVFARVSVSLVNNPTCRVRRTLGQLLPLSRGSSSSLAMFSRRRRGYCLCWCPRQDGPSKNFRFRWLFLKRECFRWLYCLRLCPRLFLCGSVTTRSKNFFILK